MRILLLILALSLGPFALGESDPVPLLPPRRNEGMLKVKQRRLAYEGKRSSYWGLDLGAEARTDGMAGTVAGMQLLYGGRVFFLFPIASRWALKPSLGYFRGGQSLAAVSVLQQSIEPGLSVEYTVARSRHIQWWVGGVDRVEILFSTINILNSGGMGIPALRNRLGPGTGFAFRLGKGLDFILDTELTASMTTPVRLYPAATAGFLLSW